MRPLMLAARVILTGLTLAAMLILILTAAARAQTDRQPRVLQRITGTITLDGHPDEPAWQSVNVLPMTTYAPVFGAPPTQRTVVRVGYDDHAIYLAASMFESDARAIQGRSLVRDEDVGGDFINLLLDTFNDNETAVTFTTTPTGARLDYSVSNDADGPNGATPAWNGFWDVATSRDERGWYAEMRVPFSTLPFQSRDGKVVMGLIVNRLIGRSNERSIFPAIQPRWTLGQFKPSQAQDVVFEGIPNRRPLRLTPYVAGGLNRTAELSVLEGRYRPEQDWRRELGGDVKYGLSNNLTLDLTANTDFAETEVDDQQVNLTRFPIFFPERRQFFLERPGIFEVGLGGSDRLFHSRRIGLTDEGRTVRIVGGARLAGRIADWDIGMLDMHTVESTGLPSENFGVLRVRRRVFNANSYAGALVTSRIGLDGQYNVMTAADGIVRLRGNDYLTLIWAHNAADDASLPGAVGSLPRELFRTVFERRASRGLGLTAAATRIGAQVDPGMGIIERRGVTRLQGGATFGIAGGSKSPVRLYTPSIVYLAVYGVGGQGLETSRWAGAWAMELKSGAVYTATVNRDVETLVHTFVLSDSAMVPPGRYHTNLLELKGTPAPGWRLSPGFTVRRGEFYDGTVTSIAISSALAVSARLRLQAEHQYDRASFASRQQRFVSHITRLRTRFSVNSRLSTTAVLQAGSAAHLVLGNLRVRYNFREGNDLWVVYNHILNTGRDRMSPVLPETQARSLVVKYTYTFSN